MANFIDTTVRINEINWTVHTEEMNCTSIGLTDYRSLDITIESDLVYEAMWRTLKHELTHAIIYSYGLDQIGKFSQEIVCDFMANYSDLLNKLAQNVLRAENTKLNISDQVEIDFEGEPLDE